MEIPAPDLDLLAEVKGSALSNHENADSLGKRSLSPPECASRHISPDSQSTPELALSLPRLALLYKPIRYMTSVYGATEIQHHWRALVRICRDQSIIPKDVITRESLENIPSYMVEYVPTGRDDRTEFRILDSSQTMARLLQVLGSHNALWESSVHEPLLSCAIESLAINFKISNASSSKAMSQFAPVCIGEPCDTTGVNFSVHFVPNQDTRLAAAIYDLVRNEPSESQSVNQTKDLETYNLPTILSIETRSGCFDEHDTKVKLGLWMATLQTRLEKLSRKDSPQATYLPAIIVFGHTWRLFWVGSLSDRVPIEEFPHDIGDTRTIPGCYRLMASLRYILGEWVPGTYLKWFGKEILCLEEEIE